MLSRRELLGATCATAAAFVSPRLACAETYPAKSVRVSCRSPQEVRTISRPG